MTKQTTRVTDEKLNAMLDSFTIDAPHPALKKAIMNEVAHSKQVVPLTNRLAGIISKFLFEPSYGMSYKAVGFASLMFFGYLAGVDLYTVKQDFLTTNGFDIAFTYSPGAR